MNVHELQAPTEDGSVLSWPSLASAGFLLEDNRRRLAALSCEIVGQPLQKVRRLAQAEVLKAAQAYMSEAGEPIPRIDSTSILLAGHQPELFHPGVWLKNFALNGLAHRQRAVALNLLVDNDTAKNTLLRLPRGDQVVQIPFDRWQSQVPYEERHVQDEQLFRGLPAAAAEVTRRWNFTPLLSEFWAEACRQVTRTPLLGERFAAARRAWERRWQCHNLEVPLSRVCRTEAFTRFVCHLLEDLPRFHGIYNVAVQDYRRRYGLRSLRHPVPDLAREGDWLESPLWAWRAGQGRRARLLVRRTPTALELRAGDEAWPALRLAASGTDLVPQVLSLQETGYKVRSRALTTTLFARLFVGDLFVHGVGGGKYDELTDVLVREFFGLEPPAFLVLTGTLRLPFPQLPATVDELQRLKRLRRDLWWNPQRHLSATDPAIASLREQKLEWIERECCNHEEQQRRFEELRKITGRLRAFLHERERELGKLIAQIDGELRVKQVQRRREYPFCLHPEEVLRAFCRQVL